MLVAPPINPSNLAWCARLFCKGASILFKGVLRWSSNPHMKVYAGQIDEYYVSLTTPSAK